MSYPIRPDAALPPPQPRSPAPAWDRGLAHQPEPDPGAPSLRDYLSFLRRHLLLVLAGGLLGLGVAVYHVQSERPRYSAHAVIRLVEDRRTLGASPFGENLAGPPASNLVSQIEVLQSRSVLGEVVDREGLRLRFVDRDMSWDFLTEIEVSPTTPVDTLHLLFTPREVVVAAGDTGRARGAYGTPLEIGGIRLTVDAYPEVERATLVVRPREETVEEMRRNFRAVPRERTDIIDLAYTDFDPSRARQVVNATAAVFQAYNARMARSESRRRREFIQQQLAQTDSLLQEAQLALSAFRDRTAVYGSQQQFEAQQEGLIGLDVRREELDSERRLFRRLLADLGSPGQEVDRNALRTIFASGLELSPVATELYAELLEHESAREELILAGRATTNPDVLRMDALIASTEASVRDALHSHLTSLNARVAALDSLKARNADEVRTLSEIETEEELLLRQVETFQELAAQLQTEHKQARLAEAIEGGQVEIVDLATLPTDPLGTGHTRTVVMGLVLGLMLGAGGAVFLEKMNTSIRKQEEIEPALRVPGLAVIPQIPVAAKRSAPLRFLPAVLGGNGKEGRTKRVGEEMVTVVDVRSSGAEAFRRLRTNLIFSQAVKTLRTIVVTSATPGEGKTTTAANLAVTFAQQGMRVLLVDCDLHRARLHKLFNVPQQPGLSELVLGHAAPAQAIRATPVERLSLLTAGTLPPNPAELLGGPRMNRMLNALGQGFDVIVLDTAPLMATADAAVLGARADGVLVVLRAGHTERAAAQQTVQQLTSVGARVVGAVLNDPDDQVKKYGYYYYSYDYYGAEETKV